MHGKPLTEVRRGTVPCLSEGNQYSGAAVKVCRRSRRIGLQRTGTDAGVVAVAETWTPEFTTFA